MKQNETLIKSAQSHPVVDVIIPAYKPERKSFQELLFRLQKQTVPVHHIYILQTVEAGQQPEKWQIDSPSLLSVHPVRKETFDHGGTRHEGVLLAAGLHSAMETTAAEKLTTDAGYVLFMTQDAMPADDRLVEELLRPFAQERTSVSYARQLAREGADILERMTREHNYPDEDQRKGKEDLDRLGIKTYFCSDVCAMYRLDRYLAQGGFVRPTIFNEDMIMASRLIDAGGQVAYCARARVIHSHQYTCMQQFHRNFDLGVSQRQYREVFERVSSEKEGAGYAGKLLWELCKKGKPGKAFYFALQCGFKLCGYQLGKRYDRLPRKVVLACTASPGYVLFQREE